MAASASEGPLSGEQHAALVAWLDDLDLAVGEPVRVTAMTGGRSNVMVAVDRGPHQWVLRMPPAVAVERADAGMRREFRVLGALTGTAVPHPAPVALHDDLFGRVGYLMTRVAGINPTPSAVPSGTDPGAVMRAVVDALAALHEVKPHSPALAGFGRPEGFHERQVSRWSKQLASYRGRELPELAEVGDWLNGHLPASWQPALLHGDYHMLNLLIDPNAPVRVSAVLDWETATIGDPLLDLAGLAEVWRVMCEPAPGWPAAPEVLARYLEVRGLGTGDLTYYAVLYNFRLSVLLEGIYQRSLRDVAPKEDTGRLARANARRALDLARDEERFGGGWPPRSTKRHVDSFMLVTGDEIALPACGHTQEGERDHGPRKRIPGQPAELQRVRRQ